jgi:hypothetical protein
MEKEKEKEETETEDTNIMVDIDYTFEDLDTSWLDEFEKMDKEYKSYYSEDLLFIRVHYIYINSNQEITNVYEEKQLFKKPGILSKEDLIGLIKRNTIINQTKYSLLSILKYNINIEPINLKTFFRSKNKNIGSTYLQSIKHIDDIIFHKSISMFHDLNDLIILFLEKGSSSNHNTVTTSDNNNKSKGTKRIYINDSKYLNKKTRRNLFKDNN